MAYPGYGGGGYPGGGYQGGGYPGGGYPEGGYPGGGYQGGGYPGGGYQEGYIPGQGGPFPMSEGYMDRREFYIVSELHEKVLDIEGDNPAPNTKVCVYHKKNHRDHRNQLWYLDEQGVIHSVLNSMGLQAERGHHVHMQQFYGGPEQQWRFQDGGMIVNGNGDCLDVKGSARHDGAEVIAYEYNGGQNQRWRMEYPN